MNGRMLWIEIRRNELLLLFPIVAALYGFVVWQSILVHSVLFWADSSVWTRNAIVLLGPFAGAVAAWMAGRDRRHGLDDLIATTPRPPLGRDLTVCAATVLLGIAAYVVIAAAVLGRTATQASWDGPYFSVLIPGLITIAAMAAIGYPIGRIVPRRVTAILVGAGLIIAVALPITVSITTSDSWTEYLSPLFEANASPWWGIQPDIALPQSIFLLGIAYLGLAGVAAVGRARNLALAVLVVAIVTSTIGVGTIRAGVRAEGEPEIIAYEPVCAGNPVTVCLHPAFERLLDDLAEGANAVVAPFVGFNGVPTRFEQIAPGVGGVEGNLFSRDGARAPQSGFFIDDADPVVIVPLSQIASSLLAAPDAATSPLSSAWQARLVVELWLMESAGYGLTCEGDMAEYQIDLGLGSSWGFGFGPVPCDEAEQFAALDPDVRLDWLRQNYAAIRAGEIMLEDLP